MYHSRPAPLMATSEESNYKMDYESFGQSSRYLAPRYPAQYSFMYPTYPMEPYQSPHFFYPSFAPPPQQQRAPDQFATPRPMCNVAENSQEQNDLPEESAPQKNKQSS